MHKMHHQVLARPSLRVHQPLCSEGKALMMQVYVEKFDQELEANVAGHAVKERSPRPSGMALARRSLRNQTSTL
jgi:hypothetical protein